jgi:hypothetical protein
MGAALVELKQKAWALAHTGKRFSGATESLYGSPGFKKLREWNPKSFTNSQ